MGKKGQSVLEYVIVLTAIIVAVILIGRNVINRAVENAMRRAGDSIESSTTRLPGAGSGGGGTPAP
jgi:uncharacterized protein (UPF0333 family)